MKISSLPPPSLTFHCPLLSSLLPLPPLCLELLGSALARVKVDLVMVTGSGWVAVGCWMSFTGRGIFFFFLGTSPEKLKGEKGGKEECDDCKVLCWERCSSSGVYGEGFQGDLPAWALAYKSWGGGVEGGGHLSADSANNGETDDEGVEQKKKKRGGRREGRVAERENMRKCVECIHYKEKSAFIQEAPHAWSAGTKGSF